MDFVCSSSFLRANDVVSKSFTLDVGKMVLAALFILLS